MHHLSPSVMRVTGRLIDLLDARFPGQLDALYLVGSVALGDYREGRSDVDFIAVLGGSFEPALLAAVHGQLASEHVTPHCDGIYLRPRALAAPPGGTGIEAREGRITEQSPAERNAVTWLTLAESGIALRGRQPDESWIAVDRQAAIAHSRTNLETYWRPWINQRRNLLSAGGLTLLSDDAVAWGALGIARLHAMIAEGRIVSKTGAGEYALAAFPQHARLVREALRLRVGAAATGHYRNPFGRRRDLVAFMDAVLGSVTA